MRSIRCLFCTLFVFVLSCSLLHAQQSANSPTAISSNSTTEAAPEPLTSATLDVKRAATVRGILTLPPVSATTAIAGKNSQPLSMAASAFNSSNGITINEFFNWQVEPVANNASAPTGILNLLFGSGTAKAKETGLKIGSDGQIPFVPGHMFPGGNGSVWSVGLSAALGLQ